MKFLIDENLSPKVADHLRSLGYSASAVRDEGLRGETDEDIVIWARKEKSVIVTRDLDFGFLYRQLGTSGVLILRGKNDSTEASLKIIDRLHRKGYLKQKDLSLQLTVATESRVRVFKNPSSIN